MIDVDCMYDFYDLECFFEVFIDDVDMVMVLFYYFEGEVKNVFFWWFFLLCCLLWFYV